MKEKKREKEKKRRKKKKEGKRKKEKKKEKKGGFSLQKEHSKPRLHSEAVASADARAGRAAKNSPLRSQDSAPTLLILSMKKSQFN